jgi:integral membrane protein (TIGR01906 family)
MVWLSRLAAAAFIVALPLLLITSNVRFMAGEVRLYERGFRAYDSNVRTGLPLSELDRAAQDVIDYFENDAPTLRITVTDSGDEVALYNARETEHMKDVKWLMQVIFRVNEVTLAYVLTYIAGVFLWAGAGSLRKLAWLSLGGIGVGAAIVGFVLGAAALFGFDATWTRFHKIVFNNDLWQLNPLTDRLIQMFPEPFWQNETYILAGITLAEVFIIVVGAVACLLFTRGEHGPGEDTPRRPERARVTRSRAVKQE